MSVSSNPLSGKTVHLARGLTALIVLASVVGLLSIPLGVYDDSLMIVGARLLGAGKLPYVDFYTHYGPLGYTLIDGLSRLTRDPLLAMRILQAALLAFVAVLVHVAVRRLSSVPNRSEIAAPLAVLALSGSAAFPSFLGLGFAVASLFAFVIARSLPFGRAMAIGTAGAGVLLAMAALSRPGFALYVGGAILLTEAVLFIRWRADRSPIAGVLLLAGTVGSSLLLWFLLYPSLPLRSALQAGVLAPFRLHGSGSRYLEPGFLGLPLAGIAVGTAIAASVLVWTFFTPTRRMKILGVACSIALGFFPVLYRLAWPGKPLAFFGFLVLTACLVSLWSARRSLREDPALAAAAFMGMAAAALTHYLWTRFDGPHLLPSFGLAACAAALCWPRMRRPGRLAVLGLFAVTYGVAARNWAEPLLPLARLSGDAFPVIERGRLRWPFEELPSDPARAVALADSNADPGSRFVAVASSHATSQGSPVMLFALSSRLPYTKWFQYDPGVQTSAPIQRSMERELLDSGSRSAVVWRANRFRFDRRREPVGARSELDAFFDRLYPRVLARFGDFEVRERETPDREASR